jgi:hypothetical protein
MLLLVPPPRLPNRTTMTPKTREPARNALSRKFTETKMKKKKIQQDKIDREKESVRKHEEVIKK